MQRQISITNATINAFAAIEFGQAVVVANAVAGTSLSCHHADSKCPDPGKSDSGSLGLWREGEMWRETRTSDTTPSDVSVSYVPGMSYLMPSDVAMPARVWASWVLSRSLCG